MLQEVLDLNLLDKDRMQRETDFLTASEQLTNTLLDRIDLATLFELVNKTGAEDGDTPELSGTVTENDLITALKLFIRREGRSLPATYNGLGYNNLRLFSLASG